MTVWKDPDRKSYRYRFYLRKQRYEGSTKCTTAIAAQRFEEALMRELRLEMGGLVPHRLLKVPVDQLAVQPDGQVYIDSHREANRRLAARLRDELIAYMNEPHVTSGIRGFVYFIGQGGVSPIKIGYAANVRDRLRNLRTSNPNSLQILTATPGSKHVEQRIHDQFREFRIGESEWFHSGDYLLAFIGLLKERPIVNLREGTVSKERSGIDPGAQATIYPGDQK